ncbi:TPA: GtrA family protein [Candidatus Thalassarchaeaceae archaeon]|jgi:putative flippase GtrA|nr:GtrA family protein [Candidatus Thalassarchaeum sp.]MDA7556079.1 GtrA family protein [Euryarchaeota archaeon]DAC63972.1 MAG TPA: GtrA family protein [Candidatus Poseidoniales archaeon]HIH06083.1 GtrA family protein [Candidatus Thalassarchaeaceae archaeon]MDC0962760.1 GtrA family protein [Euryarchaeota archaeon]|tara:strand:- start:181 stop:660 length:480 start_codon:yes stop_codon:yes gene_type:complete
MPKIVSDEYPWSKLLREYVMYCAVGCINVAIFFGLYWFFSNYATMTKSPETFGWAVSFLISSAQAFVLHRWLTFESESEIRSSFTKMMIVYGVLWFVSTITFYFLVEVIVLAEFVSWGINTAAFGFLTFLGLRFFAFPLSDGRVTRKERLDNFRERRKA